MRVITKRDKIRNVLPRWKEQYSSDFGGKTSKLGKLDFNICSEKDISDIIGNDSWTDLYCSECGRDSQIVVRFIERYEDEYEANSCDLCLNCINKGKDLISIESVNSQDEGHSLEPSVRKIPDTHSQIKKEIDKNYG